MPVVVGSIRSLDGKDETPANGDWRFDSELSLLRLTDGRFAAVWRQNAPDTPETIGGQTFTVKGARVYYSIFDQNGAVIQSETLIDFARYRDGGNVNPQFNHMGLEATAIANGGLAVTFYDTTRFPENDPYATWLAFVAADGTQSASYIGTDNASFQPGLGTSGAGAAVWGYQSTAYSNRTLIVGGENTGIRITGEPQITAFGAGYAFMYIEDVDPTSGINLDVFLRFEGNGLSTTVRVHDETAGRQDLVSSGNGEQAATLRDGGVVVLWNTFVADGNERTQYRIYNTDGTARTGELTLNTPRASEYAVVALDTGGFAVIHNGDFLRLQAFDANGVAAPGEALTLPADRNVSLASFDLVDLGGGRVFAGWTQFDEPRGVVVDLQLPNVLRGTSGVDSLLGKAAAEQIFGLDGADLLRGAGGDDELRGGAGGDRLSGGDNNDTVYGEAGDDQLFGDAGDDKLYGGEGNDTFRTSAGSDLFNGGAGLDVVNFGEATAANIFLDGSGRSARSAVGDTFVGVENLIGSATGGDWLVGDAGANRLTGQGGADTLWGRGGVDQLEGGAGEDELNGGVGNDVLMGGADADRFVFDIKPVVPATRDLIERDRITDFQSGLDKLQIDASAFGGGLTAGGTVTLIANANPSSAGQGSGGVFLYDTDTGFLSWDADGQNPGVPVLFVWLQNIRPSPPGTSSSWRRRQIRSQARFGLTGRRATVRANGR